MRHAVRFAVGFGDVPVVQRMDDSLCGVCFGILLFLGSIFLLGWNEFNYVRNQAILLKVDKEVIEAGCVPSASNVGKPIWASCVVQRGYDFTTDPQVQSMGLSFSGEIRGAWFKADSTILQWTESCSNRALGGGGWDVVCYYNLEWVSSPQSSSSFCCYPSSKPGCQRSGLQIQNSGTIPTSFQQTLNAPDGTVGMGSSTDSLYFLDNKEMGVFPSVPVTVPSGQRTSLLPNKQLVQVNATSVQFSSVPGQNSIGDVRTTFTQSQIQFGLTQVAIIAKQAAMSTSNAQMRPWDTQLPGSMSLVDWASMGGLSKSDMINEKQSDNSAMVIASRFVGFILLWLGLQLVTGPIALMPEIIPWCGEMIGEIVGCALCCMNCLISLALSLTVIGVAWLMARPILGIGLLLVAAAAVCGAGVLCNKFRKNAREPSMSQSFTAPQINMAQMV